VNTGKREYGNTGQWANGNTGQRVRVLGTPSTRRLALTRMPVVPLADSGRTER